MISAGDEICVLGSSADSCEGVYKVYAGNRARPLFRSGYGNEMPEIELQETGLYVTDCNGEGHWGRTPLQTIQAKINYVLGWVWR